MTSPFLRLARWLREHRLLQVYALYLAASWLVLQVAALFVSNFGLPRWFFPAAILLLLIGLVVVTATALAQRAAAQPTIPPIEAIAESFKVGRLPALTWRRALLGGAVAFALWGVAATAFILARGAKGDRAGKRAEAPAVVAVLPFRSVGPGLELWREGMVDLLSTNLDAAGELRAVDARAVLSRWRDRVGEGKDARDSRAALEVARELNARFAVLGSVVALGERVRLVAELHEVGGPRRAEAQADGSLDSVFALVDRITVDLLGGALQAGMRRDVRLEAVTTSSLPALKAYLRGEQLFRRGRLRDALAEYAQAVSIDSAFALAHWRLSQVYGWVLEFEPRARAAAVAARHADRLPERIRLVLLADRARADGRFSALGMYRALVERYPDDVDAWFGLADAIFHSGFLVNLPQDASLEGFGRAQALDSTHVQALIHPFNLFLSRGDSLQAGRHLSVLLAIDPSNPVSLGFRIAYDLVFGDHAESAEALAALDTASRETLGWANEALYGVPVYESGLAVARAQAAPRHPKASRLIAHADLLRNRLLLYGQGRAAQRELEAAEAVDPLAPIAPLYVIDYLAGYGDSALAARAALKLETRPESVARWLLGALALRWGNDAGVERQLAALRAGADSVGAAGDTVEAERALGLHQGLNGLRLAARGDNARASDSLGRAAPRMSGTGPYRILREVTRYHRYRLAEVLERAGRKVEALEIFRVFAQDPWAVHFHLPAALAAARIEERRGERESAIAHYAQVLRMWERADPQFQPQVEETREATRRLTGERASP